MITPPLPLRILSLLLSCALLVSARAADAPAVASRRPNIIYIMADDHATAAIGAYGGPLAGLNPTPTLDRLAREGVRFSNCHVVNSICTPSRASILTGQYSQTNGVLDLDQSLPTARHYLPQEMRRLGYQTALIGKWHLHAEPDFDYFNIMVGASEQGTYFDPVFIEKGMRYGDLSRERDLPTIKHEGHSTDVITDLVIDWLDKKRDPDRPFFLMHHYKAPHDMFQYAPRYETYLADRDIPEPASLYADPFWGSIATRGASDSLRREIGTSISPRHVARTYTDLFVPNPPKDPQAATSLAYQSYLKRYLRCVKGVDDNLARLFDHLKQSGLWENTIIVYTSDQGMLLGEHDLQDKRWMYDPSTHMPFIVHLPGDRLAGTVNDTLISNVSFAPTLIELAGGHPPAQMQGRSFAATLRDGQPIADWDDTVYYRYWMHMIHHSVPAHFGLRTSRYKLIFFYGLHYDEKMMGTKTLSWEKFSNKVIPTPAAWEFYDLARDPEERVNRYADPTYRDTIRDLKARLKAKREALHETDETRPAIQAVIDQHWNDE